MDTSKSVFLFVFAVLLALTVALVLPFLNFFLLAVLLTVLFLPVQERLERRMGAGTSAAVIVIVASITVVLPFVYVVHRTASDAVAFLQEVAEGNVTLAPLEERIEGFTGRNVDLSSSLQSAAGTVEPDSVVSVAGTIAHTAIGVGLTLFLLFYFLKDREEFFEWLQARMPMAADTQREYYDEVEHIMKAVLFGHVLVALIQGLLAGLGLIATGIPNATFWTVVMTVLSLLPIVGSFLVWGPAAVFLFLNGQPTLAVGLFLWGAIVVGVSDDYLRPIVVDRYAKINPGVIILGVLGGIYVIGFMGIFYGPVVIGMLKVTVDAFADEFSTSEID
ncbi:AI-2E family transporter [Halorubrum sp. JWXQ-INN 858]|uniref:AI-2E family transporter n=1 Tax=Halorubrum sp. JWXQ-INN 858 TaxID=2690782 RepID=UPI001357A1EB|nr:AI-2E family transporter [Halorubrum sp. JWXQ-INN 858]MWV64007.1 AI-2E family transporter [Halorubrum sp. JWXQ-INN 858]